ncbi:hypothetical protein [Psittacicella gerlachiana]|nr:hypothetical protein [Psittacicella gerlachiana]
MSNKNNHRSNAGIARRYRELRKRFPDLQVYDAKKDFGFNLEHLSRGAANISSHLEMADYDTYFVGGVMRDIILGKDYNDIDICTSATPSQIKQLFKGRCQIIGRRFQITHVAAGDKRYDVATFRVDRSVSRDKLSSEQRKAADNGILMVDNAFSTDVGEDAKRRDFTINALFGKVLTNEILDFYNGIDHLINRRVVMIGDPDIRLREDPMRIIRAIRLSAKLNFTIDEDLRKNMFTHKNLLKFTSESRLSDEINKTLASGAAFKVIELFSEYDLNDITMPQFHDVVTEEIGGKVAFTAIKGFKPEFAKLIAEQHTNLKRLLEEVNIDPNLIKAYSPTLALTLAGALITDQRVAYDQPVNPAFLLATMRTVGFIEVFLRYYNGLAKAQMRKPGFAKEIEGVLLSLAENSFSETCNKFNGRDKENTKTILCNLAVQFITPGKEQAAKRMNEPMFRAAFSIFRLFMQIFEVEPEIMANFRTWDKLNQQYLEEAKRRRPVRRNPQGEIISSKRRREVPDFPYMDISDQELHLRLAPSIVNIQQAIALHQNYGHKRSAGLELLDLFIKKRREYYHYDQDDLARELGQEQLDEGVKSQAEKFLASKKRLHQLSTSPFAFEGEDYLGASEEEEDPELEKARRHQVAKKILHQTSDEDMSSDVNAIPFASDLDLYYDRAAFQTVYNADFDQAHDEDLKQTEEQTLGRISHYNREKLDQIFHEFDNDFYLRELGAVGKGWDTSKRDAALARMYAKAPQLSQALINLYASDKAARASAREKALEVGLDPNLPYEELVKHFSAIEEMQINQRLKQSALERKQQVCQRLEQEKAQVLEALAQQATPELEQKLSQLESELANYQPVEEKPLKNGEVYSLDAHGNILLHQEIPEEQIVHMEYRNKQFAHELQRRYDITKNQNIVAELHAKGMYDLDDAYDTYDDGSSLEDFFEKNHFSAEDIEHVTNGGRTYEQMYEHLEALEHEYREKREQGYSDSLSQALTQAYQDQASEKETPAEDDFAALDNIFAPKAFAYGEIKFAGQPLTTQAQRPTQEQTAPVALGVNPEQATQLSASVQQALRQAMEQSAEQLLDLQAQPQVKVEVKLSPEAQQELEALGGSLDSSKAQEQEQTLATSENQFQLGFTSELEMPTWSGQEEVTQPARGLDLVMPVAVEPVSKVSESKSYHYEQDNVRATNLTGASTWTQMRASTQEQQKQEQQTANASLEASLPPEAGTKVNHFLAQAVPGSVTDLSQAQSLEELLTYYQAFAPGLLPAKPVLELISNLLQLPGVTINEYKLLKQAVKLPAQPPHIEVDQGQKEAFGIQVIALLEKLLANPQEAPTWLAQVKQNSDLTSFLERIPSSHEFSARIHSTFEHYETAYQALVNAFERLDPLVEKLHVEETGAYLAQAREYAQSNPEIASAVDSAKSSYDFMLNFKRQHLNRLVYSQEQLDELASSYQNFKACVEIGQTLQCILQYQNRFLQEFWVVVEDNYPFGGPSHSINIIMQCVNKLKAINSRNIGIVSKFIEYALTVLANQVAYATYYTASIERRYYLQKTYAQHEINLAKKLYALTQQFAPQADLGLPEDILGEAEVISNEATTASQMLKELKVKEIRRLHRELIDCDNATKRVAKNLFASDSKGLPRIAITNINGILKEYQDRVESIHEHQGLFAQVATLFAPKPGQGDLFGVGSKQIETFALDLALRCELFDHCHISKSQRRRLLRLGVAANQFAHEGTPVNTLGMTFEYLQAYPQLREFFSQGLGVKAEQVEQLIAFNAQLLALQLHQEEQILNDHLTEDLQGLSARAKAYALEYPQIAQANRAHLEQLSLEAVALDQAMQAQIDLEQFMQFTAYRGQELGLVYNLNQAEIAQTQVSVNGQDAQAHDGFKLNLAMDLLELPEQDKHTQGKHTLSMSKEQVRAEESTSSAMASQATIATEVNRKEALAQERTTKETQATNTRVSTFESDDADDIPALPSLSYRSDQANRALTQTRKASSAAALSIATALGLDPEVEQEQLHEQLVKEANPAQAKVNSSTQASSFVTRLKDGESIAYQEFISLEPEIFASAVNQLANYGKQFTRAASQNVNTLMKEKNALGQEAIVNKQRISAIEPLLLNKNYLAKEQGEVTPELKAEIKMLEAQLASAKTTDDYYQAQIELLGVKLARLKLDQAKANKVNELVKALKHKNEENYQKFMKQFVKAQGQQDEIDKGLGLLRDKVTNFNNQQKNLEHQASQASKAYDKSKAQTSGATPETKLEITKEASKGKLQDSDIKFIKEFREGYKNRNKQLKLLESKRDQLQVKVNKALQSYQITLAAAGSAKSKNAKQLKQQHQRLQENLESLEANVKGTRSNLERMVARFKNLLSSLNKLEQLNSLSGEKVQEIVNICNLLNLTPSKVIKEKALAYTKQQQAKKEAQASKNPQKKKAKAKGEKEVTATQVTTTPEVEGEPKKKGLLKRALSFFGIGKK